jgi:hypothetical protein
MKHLIFSTLISLLALKAQAQNVGIGPITPSAKLSISTTGTELSGTVMSSSFRTNAGNLGSNTGDEISLASIGFIAGGNNTSLGIRAYRNSAGTSWSNTALLFEYDVDNTVRAGSGFLALNANGNIGIGTTSPGEKLTVLSADNNSVTNIAAFYPNNLTQGIGIGYDEIRKLGTTANSNLFINAKGSGNLILENSATGNVGIGTNAPNAPLGFPPTLGKKITLYPGATGDVGMAVLGNLFEIYSDNPSADIAFGYDVSGTMTERMRIKGNGNIGIGTNNPGAKLHISAGDASLALFGPNSFGGMLYIGATPNNQSAASIAQVIASDGNLHLDPASGKNIYMGYFQARDIYLNPTGGKVGIGTTIPATTLEVNGYTKLGSDAPSIKVKKFTGTTAATESGFVIIAHGLDNSKILSVSVMVFNSFNEWVEPNIGVFPEAIFMSLTEMVMLPTFFQNQLKS